MKKQFIWIGAVSVFASALLFTGCEQRIELARVDTTAGATLDSGVKGLSPVPGATATPTPTPTPTITPTPITPPEAQTGAIHGLVKDAATGAVLPGATVSLDGGASTTTDATGAYVFAALPPGNYTVDFHRSGYIDLLNRPVTVTAGQDSELNVALTQPLALSTFRIVLSWCSSKTNAVRDVDAYLAIPGASLPIYFHSKDHDGAILDVDDTNWVGPETVTINIPRMGTYTYYVNNYNVRSQSTALGNSSVSVTVYQGSQLVKHYTVPQGTGVTFEVFRIVDGAIQDVLQYNNSLAVATTIPDQP